MNLRLSTAPLIRSNLTTKRLMRDVLIALAPCTIMGIYRFGLNAALLLVISVLTAVLAEYLWMRLMKRPMLISDCSAAVTGLILGLNLPPTAPWWTAVIGSALAILLVKQLFGGIGDNFLNPAMAARAILLASWPVHMTTFMLPVNALVYTADAVTGATPLATGNAGYMDLLMGNIPGSIGEISALMILLGLAYLLVRKVITIIIPAAMLLSTALFSWLFGADPLYAVLAGGVLFGAVFMATDYTTTPMTRAGQAIFGVGAGLIVAIIRAFGAYPEGVTYAILLMNVVTPLIDKFVKPKLFGRPPKQKKEVQA